MTARIGVPDMPGLNGVEDTIAAVKAYGMEPVPLWFHFHNKEELSRNAERLKELDGAVLSGGFPYQDRLGFGKVPSRIAPLYESVRQLADAGRPVLAYCAGDQIAAAMGLLFEEGSPHRVRLEPNIADRDGDIVWTGFRDDETYIRLEQAPGRNAFTREWVAGQAFKGVIDHGGGRLAADDATLRYLLDNGMVLLRYTDEHGRALPDWPINPNGSDLNIESLSNRRGNVKIGMVHHERMLNARHPDKSNFAFLSMREYIEDACPDLSIMAASQRETIPLERKEFAYLRQRHDAASCIDVYVEMLTDDNERNTASLFLDGMSLERRRLLRIGVTSEYASEEGAREVLTAIAQRDLLDGIMLKKDLPTVVSPSGGPERYEIVDARTNARAFVPQESLVHGHPVSHIEFPELDPHGYVLARTLRKDERIARMISSIAIGRGWFFRNEAEKRDALERLLAD